LAKWVNSRMKLLYIYIFDWGNQHPAIPAITYNYLGSQGFDSQ
jgi:hypothetical protein